MPNAQARRGAQQSAQPFIFPAPIKGINAIAPMAGMDPEECIFTYNLIAEDFGMEVRDGFLEWANGWPGGAARTAMPFEGNIDTDDRLFVASFDGIFDVTVQGTIVPLQVVTFPNQTGNAGICSFVNYGNDAGDRFLLVCDGQNGYYVWTQSTDTWAKITTEIIGADATQFNFVMIWKTRVWFVEKDTGIAHFLDKSDEFIGTVSLFNWGDQFRFGGALVSLHNWTLDGGRGMDDYLVGLSDAGDIIVYQGLDPTSKSDFGLVGSWYIGEVPAGNRIASEFSGELYILSVQGLISLSELLNGSAVSSPETYMTAKVSPYIRGITDTVLKDFGWHVHIHPKQSLLFVNTPPRASQEQIAFVLYFGHRSWSIFRGLNKAHTANWRGEVYWTDIDTNKIYIQRGHVDNVLIDPETDGPARDIQWSLLTAYSDLGVGPTFKRMHFARANFFGFEAPSYLVQASYDFRVNEILGNAVGTGELESGLWNVDSWNNALWTGSESVSHELRGVTGMGRHVAIALKGSSSKAVTLVSFDCIFDTGGMV